MTIPNLAHLDVITEAWVDAIAGAGNHQTNRLACHLTRSVGQTTTSGVATAVLFDLESFDAGGLHSTSVNTSRITVPAGGGGLWLVNYTLTFASNGVGARAVYMARNGNTSHRHGLSSASMAGAGDFSGSGTTLLRLASTDFVELVGLQSSGAGLNVLGDNSAAAPTSFSATRLGD